MEAHQKTMQQAVDAAARGDTTPINFQRYKLKDLELTPEEYAYFQNAGLVDKTLGGIENVSEAIEIAFNPDEILQTAAWAGSLRGINALLRRGDTTEFTDQYTPQQSQSAGPFPADTPQQGDPLMGLAQSGIPGAQQQQTQPQALPGTTVQPGQTLITPPPQQPGQAADPSVPPGQAAGWGYTPQQVGTPTANIPQPQTPVAPNIQQGQAAGGAFQQFGAEEPMPPTTPPTTPPVPPSAPDVPPKPTVPQGGGVPPVTPPVQPQTRPIGTGEPHVPSVTPTEPPQPPQVTPPGDLPQPEVPAPQPETPQQLTGQQTQQDAQQLAELARLELETPGLPKNQATRAKIWNRVVGMGDDAEFGFLFDNATVGSEGNSDDIRSYFRSDVNSPFFKFTENKIQSIARSAGITKRQARAIAHYLNRQSVVNFQDIDFETGVARYVMTTPDNVSNIEISVTPTPAENNGARVELTTPDGVVQETYDIANTNLTTDVDPRTAALDEALRIYNNTKTTVLEDDLKAAMAGTKGNASVNFVWAAEGTAVFEASANPNIRIKIRQVDKDGYDIRVVEDTGVSAEPASDEQRRGAEHMTRNKKSFDSILRTGFIDNPSNDAMTELIWFSHGGYYRGGEAFLTTGNGFIFDPQVLFKKYGLVPDLDNVGGLGTSVNLVKYPGAMGKLNKLIAENNYFIDVDFDVQRQILHKFLADNNIDITDVMEGSGIASEMTAKGPIDIKDAVAVVINDEIKIITAETRGLPPDQWQFRDPNSSELIDRLDEDGQDIVLTENQRNASDLSVSAQRVISSIAKETQTPPRQNNQTSRVLFEASPVLLNSQRAKSSTHNFIEMAEQAIELAFEIPQRKSVKKNRDGNNVYHYTISDGESWIDIHVIKAPDGKSYDVKLSKAWHKPIEITLKAKSYDKAAMKAVPATLTKWLKNNIGTKPTTPAPADVPVADVPKTELGRVIRAGNVDNQFYYRNPDDPADVILFQTELVETLNAEDLSRQVYNEVLNDRRMKSALRNEIMQFVQADRYQAAMIPDLMAKLTATFGESLAKQHLQNIQMWRKALRGDVEVHRVSATREGFKPRRNRMFINPSKNNKISQLQAYVENTTWQPETDTVRPREDNIQRAQEAIRDATDKALRVSVADFPIEVSEGVDVDIPTLTHEVGNAQVTERVLGIGQSLLLGQRLNLIGHKVRSVHELMMHAQLARDSRIESKYVVYVDSAGVVISDDVYSSGLPHAILNRGDYIPGQLIEKIRNSEDVAKIYLFHNHPTGNATPSDADIMSAAAWKFALENAGLGDRWGGSGVINSGHFSNIIDDHHYLLNQPLNAQERGWETDPMFTPSIADDRVRSIVGEKISKAWKKVAQLKHGSGGLTFIGTNISFETGGEGFAFSQHLVNSAWTLNDLDKVKNKDIPQLIQVIEDRLRFHGGDQVFAFFDDANINPKLLKALQTELGIRAYTTLPDDARPEFGLSADRHLLDLTPIDDTWHKIVMRKENERRAKREPNWFERFDDLTNRRLVDPRNGFSPQTNDIGDYKNQVARLSYQVMKAEPRVKKTAENTILAMNMARLAGIQQGDNVMVINSNAATSQPNDALLAMSSLRLQDDTGDVILSNNVEVSEHLTPAGYQKMGYQQPHVMLITEVAHTSMLMDALSFLHDDGRAVVSLHGLDAGRMATILLAEGKHPELKDYNIRGILNKDGISSGVYLIIDKKKTPSAKTIKGEIYDNIDAVRATRQPIDYRSSEQLAMEAEQRTIVPEQALSQSIGKGRSPRGIGSPNEALYVTPTEPSEPIGYLLNTGDQIDPSMERTSGAGGMRAIPAPADATGGSPVSNQAADAGVDPGRIGTETSSGSGGAPAVAGSGVGTADGVRTGLVPVGQGSPEMDSDLQPTAAISGGDLDAISEGGGDNAAIYTANAQPQPTTEKLTTPFGTETIIVGGEPENASQNQPQSDRSIIAERGKRFLNREKYGEIYDRYLKPSSQLRYTFWETGKRALHRMGASGVAILNNILKIDDRAKQLNGQFEILIRNSHKEINRLFKSDIKDRGGAKGKEWIDGELVAALERSRAVHPDIQRVADNIRDFMDKNFSQPMLDMNVDILSQGIVGDLPVDWVNGSGRDLLHRKRGKVKAYNQENPLFEKFIKSTRNVTQFVFDAQNQHVYAVLHQRRTGTRKGELLQFDDYRLLSPFGDEHRIDSLESTGFQVIAEVDDGVWLGNMEGVERVWNAEVQNTPNVDALRQAFREHGITLPDEIRFKYQQFGELDEWSVSDAQGDELYRLRYINNNAEGNMSSHPDYDDFRHRLMIYDANPRDPIMIYHGENAAHLWEPLTNYYPHMINWKELDFEGVELDNKALDYAVNFWHANEDKIDSLEQAIEILRRESGRAKGRKYGHLEQARQYNYPDYDKRFFEVLQQFSNRASERQHIIANFGQNSDILQTMLDRLIAPTELRDAMTPELQAIMKLRYAQGYRDFTLNKFAKRSGNAFMPDDQPAVIDPAGDQYRRLTTNDWQALIDANILRQNAEGQYVIVPEMVHMLETPAFSNDAMKQGFVNYSIAADIIANQYGHPALSIFEEEINNVSRAIREASGLFLMKAYATQLGQSANTVALVGARNTLRAIWNFVKDPKGAMDFSDNVGATIVDATEWHRSDTSLTSAMLGPRTDFHYKGTGLKEWVKNRAATPFMHAEKLNRWIAASAGKHYVMHYLKRLLENPQDRVSRAKLATLIPYGDHLASQLENVLSTTVKSQGGSRVTPADVDWVMDASPDDIRNNRPELKVVRDFVYDAAKTVSDVTQHRLGSADKAQMFQNPIVKAAFSLNSFNIKQTEYVKNLIAREAQIYKSYVDEYPNNKAIGMARAAGNVTLSLIPRFWGTVGFGAMAIGAGHLIRFKGFDEDDLTIAAALGQVGIAGYVGELWNAAQYKRGLHGMFTPPIVGTAFDAVQQPAKTLGSFQLPLGPTIGQWGGEQ